jgi:hypothetical protein
MPVTTNPEMETDRVRRYTSPAMLEQIEKQIEENVRFYAAQPPHIIAERIDELKREWSIERYLQVNIATAGFLTAFLALTSHRKWAVLTCTALSFFLYHGVRGFDPPIPLLRRMGVRTRKEIDRELFALKAVRGDFRDAPESPRLEENRPPISEILQAVNR